MQISLTSLAHRTQAGENELDVASPLLEDSQKQHAVPKKSPSPSGLLRVFRTLKLHAAYFVRFSRRPPVEDEKIPIVHGLIDAGLPALLHAVPVAAALVVVILNLRGYYIGSELQGGSGEDSIKLLALQFTAKLHELLMVASMTYIVFDRLRQHMVSDDGIPLGGIAAAFQVGAVSNLWSPDFIALFRTRYGRMSRQVLYVTLIFVVTVLGVIVGPSSATALQPTLGDWAAGGTGFWLNSTQAEIFPSVLNASTPPVYLCPSCTGIDCISRVWKPLEDVTFSFWPRVWQSHVVLPPGVETTFIPGDSIRSMSTRFVGPFQSHPNATFATIQSAPIASAVGKMCSLWTSANTACIAGDKGCFQYYNDITCSFDTVQPISFVRCHTGAVTSPQQFWTVDGETPGYTLVTYADAGSHSQQWFDDITSNRSTPGIQWLQLPEDRLGQTSLGATVALPKSTENDGDKVLSCTIDARWVNTTVQASFTGTPLILSSTIQQDIQRKVAFMSGSNVARYPRVTLDPQWADALNAVIDTANTTVFERLCRATGIWNHVADVSDSPHAVEAILAVMTAQGMGLSRSDAKLQGDLVGLDTTKEWQEWQKQFTSRGNGGEAFQVDDNTKNEFPRLQFMVKVNGYAYGITTSTVLSSIALLFYVLLATSHSIYIIGRSRTTSSAWDTVSELLTLALNSERTETLRNTGAGVTTLLSFEKPTRVVVKARHLELQVGVQNALPDERKVQPNKAYG